MISVTWLLLLAMYWYFLDQICLRNRGFATLLDSSCLHCHKERKREGKGCRSSWLVVMFTDSCLAYHSHLDTTAFFPNATPDSSMQDECSQLTILLLLTFTTEFIILLFSFFESSLPLDVTFCLLFRLKCLPLFSFHLFLHFFFFFGRQNGSLDITNAHTRDHWNCLRRRERENEKIVSLSCSESRCRACGRDCMCVRDSRGTRPTSALLVVVLCLSPCVCTSTKKRRRTLWKKKRESSYSLVRWPSFLVLLCVRLLASYSYALLHFNFNQKIVLYRLKKSRKFVQRCSSVWHMHAPWRGEKERANCILALGLCISQSDQSSIVTLVEGLPSYVRFCLPDRLNECAIVRFCTNNSTIAASFLPSCFAITFL